jgi:hypothetical protein
MSGARGSRFMIWVLRAGLVPAHIVSIHAPARAGTAQLSAAVRATVEPAYQIVGDCRQSAGGRRERSAQA